MASTGERTVRLLSPVAPAAVQEVGAAGRLADLNGKRLAFLDNKKSNADVFLHRLAENLGAKYHLSAAQHYRKPLTSARPFPPEVMAEIKASCDGVIAALGD